MSVELESAARLAALKSGIEAKTGETYADLTGGVNALIAGYGQGGGSDEGLTKVKWLEVDENGYPTKLDIRGLPITNYTCYRYSTYEKSIYEKLTEVYTDAKCMGLETFRYCLMLKTVHGFENIETFENGAFDNCVSLEATELPVNTISIGNTAFRGCRTISFTEIPATVTSIGNAAFNGGWQKSTMIKFRGTPQQIANNSFMNNSKLVDIYVPWAEGAVANAPWGATNATIHYNTTYDADGNPIV